MTSAWLSHAPQTDVEITKVVAGTASKILLAVVAELGRLDTGLAGRGGNDVMLEFLGSTPEIGDALSDLMPVNLVESSYISNAIA